MTPPPQKENKKTPLVPLSPRKKGALDPRWLGVAQPAAHRVPALFTPNPTVGGGGGSQAPT